MRGIRLGLACLLAMVLLMGAAQASVLVMEEQVNLYEGPGTDYGVAGQLGLGDSWNVSETAADANGAEWYYVENVWSAADNKSLSGWLSADGVVLNGSDNPIQYDAEAAQDWTELSPYYRSDLQQSAQALGLSHYRKVQSEVPNQYFNESLYIGGRDLANCIVLEGGGYKIYGAACGMSLEEAVNAMTANGLELMEGNNANYAALEHPSSEKSLVDVNGHDGILYINAVDDIVVSIEWYTYTG